MAKRLITFGPKDFLKGIGPLQTQQNEMGGFFATAQGIDLYRKPGFITPGPTGALLTNYGSIGSNPIRAIDGHIFNAAAAVNKIYGRSNTTFFEIDLNSTPPVLENSYLGFPYSTGDNSGFGHSIIQTAINGTVYTLVFGEDIGKFDGGSFTTNWGSTVPSGAAALQSGVIKRAIQYGAYTYFTNGGYIGMLDGTAATGGTNGTLYDKKLVLPVGYTAKDIKVVQGYLEIYIDNNDTAQIWTWDGISTLPLDVTYIEDQKINAGLIANGIPHVFTNGQGSGLVVRQKNFYGYPQLQTVNSGTIGALADAASVDRLNGMLLWSDTGKIWTYGNPYAQYSYRGQDSNSQFPEALNCPIVPKGGNITALKVINGQILVASNNGSYTYIESFVLNDATYNNAATWQTNFFQIPDDSTIDFVRFVVQPPASGASFTPSIFTDYATSGRALDALTSSTLDANGKSKTYFADQLGAPICDNFAIGGAYTGSSTSNPVVITRIDIGITSK